MNLFGIFSVFKKPLMLGCSGGSGHNAAIQGIIDWANLDPSALSVYTPVKYNDKKKTSIQQQIGFSAAVMELLGEPIKVMFGVTPLPALPPKTRLDQEIKTLAERNRSPRNYVDMLLDVYPEGYEYAAIWNILQRNDETRELTKLIKWQSKSDKDNYKMVYNYFFKALEDAKKADEPFSEIISTQAMSLPALCDAVRNYNKKYNESVVIHQYLTDLPTMGAVHFFNSLAGLSKKQRSQMVLHGVGLEEKSKVIQHFFPKKHSFKAIKNIPANENPMVRKGFKQEEYNNSGKFNKTCTIQPKSAPPIEIAANEKIASIMLGSQASTATIEYIETLLECGCTKIFVFGGQNEHIANKIDDIVKLHPEYNERIIRLANQDDPQITSIMTRSNIVVIRGGGLSAMEQMAMPHNENQIILVHHADSPDKELSSGISWEDGNTDELLEEMRAKGLRAEKVSPQRARRIIINQEITLAMDGAVEKEMLANLPLSNSTLKQCTQWIKEGNKEVIRQYFSSLAQGSTNEDERKNLLHIETLNSRCDNCKSYLEKLILTEAKNCQLNLSLAQIITQHQSISEQESEEAPIPFSSTLNALVKSYKGVDTLQMNILTQENKPFAEKLTNFRDAYPRVKENILAYSDNKIKQFLSEIIYQLAMIFGAAKNPNPLSIFSPVQNLRKDIEAEAQNAGISLPSR